MVDQTVIIRPASKPAITLRQGSASVSLVQRREDVTIATKPADKVIVNLSGRPGQPGQDAETNYPATHAQTAPASVWVVNHNLGRNPLVQVFSPGGVLVQAGVDHPTPNQFRVTFVNQQTGFVRYF